MSPYRMGKIEESVRTAMQFLDCINSKNLARLGEIIDDKCVFNDLWERAGACAGKDGIIAYFDRQFTGAANTALKATEANNFGHTCVIKYKLLIQTETDTAEHECLGLFEVHSGLIKSISIYGKK